MQAIEFQTSIKNGTIEIPRMYRQQISKQVRVIVLSEKQSENGAPLEKRPFTAADLLQSELVGIWVDREEIADGLGFARQLRYRAEHQRENARASA